jgi:hypothetical protein
VGIVFLASAAAYLVSTLLLLPVRTPGREVDDDLGDRGSVDVRQQRFDRGPFIGTVTGNARSADAADAVVGSRLGLRSGFTSL